MFRLLQGYLVAVNETCIILVKMQNLKVAAKWRKTSNKKLAKNSWYVLRIVDSLKTLCACGMNYQNMKFRG